MDGTASSACCLPFRLALVSVAASSSQSTPSCISIYLSRLLHLCWPQSRFTFWYDGITPGILADVLSSLVHTCLSESAANALSSFSL